MEDVVHLGARVGVGVQAGSLTIQGFRLEDVGHLGAGVGLWLEDGSKTGLCQEIQPENLVPGQVAVEVQAQLMGLQDPHSLHP